MKILVKRLSVDAVLPAYAHPGDAGLDLFSNVELTISPGDSAPIPTGISMELPPDTEAQVRPRSGLAKRKNVTVLNSPGTIDFGYRGEVLVLLINHGTEPFVVEKGMKIAQMVIAPVLRAQIEEVEELSETKRGHGGFGSTGMG